MSAAEQAAALREQATALEQIGKLEEAAGQAKQAYQADPTSQEAKDRHRAAGQALADAREARRPSKDVADVTVTPEPAAAAGNPGEVQ